MKVIKQRLDEELRDDLKAEIRENAKDKNRQKQAILSKFGLDTNADAVYFQTDKDVQGWKEVSLQLQDGRTPGRILLYGGHMYLNGETESETVVMYSIDWECKAILLARKTMILAIYS